uniref:Uncharacterized protein n=1 Tax=Arundo donax TaxID=35708 RepID=A0A0A9AWL0_ARUDO
MVLWFQTSICQPQTHFSSLAMLPLSLNLLEELALLRKSNVAVNFQIPLDMIQLIA